MIFFHYYLLRQLMGQQIMKHWRLSVKFWYGSIETTKNIYRFKVRQTFGNEREDAVMDWLILEF